MLLIGVILNLGFVTHAVAQAISIDDIKTHWGTTLAGAAATIAIHEAGHFWVAEHEGADAYFDGLTVRYENTNNTAQQNIRLSSAGFQAQWIAAEYALNRLKQNESSAKQRSWNAGLVIGHIGIPQPT